MRKQLVAVAAACALAMGGFSAQPARAGDSADDLAKFILFSAFVIAATNSGRSEPDKPAAVHRKRPPVAGYHAPYKPHKPRYGYKPRRATCLEDFWNGHSWVTFDDIHCRRANGRHGRFRSVDACLRVVWSRGMWVEEFDLNCMRNRGFTAVRLR